MEHRQHRTRVLAPPFLVAAVCAAVLAPGCAPRAEYRAEIRRTSHGIAHITADTLADLGFGEGYAQAEDHLCSLADQVVRARSERARFFGRGERDQHLNSDLTLLHLDLYRQAARDLATMPAEVGEWMEGYAAGYNLYLEETGRDQVAGFCRGAEWVRPITANDLAAYHRIVTLAASVAFADAIATAQPPGAAGVATASAPARASDQASNGWAIGSELARSGRGMLIANPHYPWVGSNRFWEKHLVVPGDLEVYGVGLIGTPGVAIGFNRAVAWTHTVSAGERYTLYALPLVAGNPTSYRYGDAERALEAATYAVEVKGDDGALARVERTLYRSHYGPLLALPDFGWTSERAFALRDVNRDNDEGRPQWLAMNRARSMDEFQQAHAAWNAMPWVNTIATSAEGRAWYTDGSRTPNLSAEAIALWQERRTSDQETARAWRDGMVLLDGGDPRFEWQDDDGARDPGVVAFADMPQLERRDYVFNANDSFWLANSHALLTGYSPLHGLEQTVRSLRTRRNDTTLGDPRPEGPRGEDGKLDLAEMQAAILQNRGMTADLLRSELVERCGRTPRATLDGRPVDLLAACAVLASWDGRYELDRSGAVLFREWISQYAPEDLRGKGRLFAVDFDPADPIGTPRGLAPAGASGDLALENLARATELLARAGLALDTPLGAVQYAPRGSKRIPIHGGDGGYEGIENFVRRGPNGTTLEPEPLPPVLAGSRLLSAEGYVVNSGTSFLMALEYTDSGPRAEAFLTYGQSGDPSAAQFSDQTELFSRKEWRQVRFEAHDVAADVQASKLVRAPRGQPAT